MQPIRGSTFLEEVGESMVPVPAAEHGAVRQSGAIGDAKAQELQVVRAGEVEQRAAVGDSLAAQQAVLIADFMATAFGDADGDMCVGGSAAAERRESSPTASELSTGKMNPRAPGWNKRPEGYIWNMELVWLPLMSDSVSLDNVEEVGGVPTSGAGSDGCIAPRDQSGCEAQPQPLQ